MQKCSLSQWCSNLQSVQIKTCFRRNHSLELGWTYNHIRKFSFLYSIDYPGVFAGEALVHSLPLVHREVSHESQQSVSQLVLVDVEPVPSYLHQLLPLHSDLDYGVSLRDSAISYKERRYAYQNKCFSLLKGRFESLCAHISH